MMFCGLSFEMQSLTSDSIRFSCSIFTCAEKRISWSGVSWLLPSSYSLMFGFSYNCHSVSFGWISWQWNLDRDCLILLQDTQSILFMRIQCSWNNQGKRKHYILVRAWLHFPRHHTHIFRIHDTNNEWLNQPNVQLKEKVISLWWNK